MNPVAPDPWVPEHVLHAVRTRYGMEHVHAGFDPKRTALVVVDMQIAFLRPEGGYVVCAAALDIIPAINRLASAVRAAGGLVVWLKNIHDERTDTDWPVMTEMAGEASNARRAAALAPDSVGFALDPSLDVHNDDEIVIKRRYSAFLQESSDLEAILKSRGIDTLLMAGTTTDVCVESSARDAMMCNFKVIVVSDATAALSDGMHVGALSAIYFHFGDVMPTEMVLDGKRLRKNSPWSGFYTQCRSDADDRGGMRRSGPDCLDRHPDARHLDHGQRDRRSPALQRDPVSRRFARDAKGDVSIEVNWGSELRSPCDCQPLLHQVAITSRFSPGHTREASLAKRDPYMTLRREFLAPGC